MEFIENIGVVVPGVGEDLCFWEILLKKVGGWGKTDFSPFSKPQSSLKVFNKQKDVKNSPQGGVPQKVKTCGGLKKTQGGRKNKGKKHRSGQGNAKFLCFDPKKTQGPNPNLKVSLKKNTKNHKKTPPTLTFWGKGEDHS